MADTGLTVAVTADVTNLLTQVAVGKASQKDLGASVRAMAADYASASADVKSTMLPVLQNLVAQHAAVTAEIAKNTKELRKNSDEVGSNRATFMELGHSARAMADGMAAGIDPMRLLAMEAPRVTQALLEMNGVTIGTIARWGLYAAAVAAAGGAFAVLASRLNEYKAAADNSARLSALNIGMAPDQIYGLERGLIEAGRTTKQLGDLTGEAAGKIVTSFASMRDATPQLTDALTHILPDFSALTDQKPEKAAEDLQHALTDLSGAGQKMLEALRPGDDVLRSFQTALAANPADAQKILLEQLTKTTSVYATNVDSARNSTLRWWEALGMGESGISEDDLRVAHAADAAKRLKSVHDEMATAEAALPTNVAPDNTAIQDSLAKLAQDTSKTHDQILTEQIGYIGKILANDRLEFSQRTALQREFDALSGQARQAAGERAIEETRLGAERAAAAAGTSRAAEVQAQIATYNQLLASSKLTADQRVEIETRVAELQVQLVRRSASEGKKATDEEFRDFTAQLETKLAAAKGHFLAQILLVNQWAAQARATYGEDSTQYAAAVRKKIEIDQQWAAAIEKADKQRLESARNLAEAQASLDKIGAKPDMGEFKSNVGLIFDDSDLQGKVAAQVAKLKEALDADLAELNADMTDKVRIGDAVGAQDDLKQAAARIQQFADQSRETNERAADAVQQAWDKALSPIGNAFNAQIDAMLRGQEGFGQAAERVAGSVLEDWLKTIINMGAKWVGQQLLMTVSTTSGAAARSAAETAAEVQTLTRKAAALGFHLTAETTKTGATIANTATRTTVDTAGHVGLLARLAAALGIHIGDEAGKTAATVTGEASRRVSQTAATAAGQATQIASNIATIQSDAAVAAAGAYAATAAIPVVGPALAPAAATEAYSTVTAFQGLVAAEGGWGQVPYDGAPAVLHKNEMVLPAALAQRVRDITASGPQLPAQARVGGAPSAAPTGGQGTMPAGLPGGSFHYAPTISVGASQGGGMSRSDFVQLLDAHSRDMLGRIRDYTRNGTLQHYGRA